ncbi:ATP-binding protein [Actinoplanes sp. NBC_00393]|uniref:ATP-binding protein n=1 Tax=Actinoplanes sp. NBC_00393 TaxID=2975953 RepID=UPI002E1C4553
MRCEVEPIGTRLLVRMHGELCLAALPGVRASLLKCLAERPDAIVVDLSDTVVTEPAAATVFPSAARQAAQWPGTPLMVFAPDPVVAGLLTIAHSTLMVHSSLEEALSAEVRSRPASIIETMLPVSGAARRGRELAADACARWNLPELRGRASIVAGELVTNGVVHANTMLDLRLTLGRRYLMVAVRDGSTALPVAGVVGAAQPGAPRGLLLVEAMTQRWGTLPAAGGKVVWAALPRGGTRTQRENRPG